MRLVLFGENMFPLNRASDFKTLDVKIYLYSIWIPKSVVFLFVDLILIYYYIDFMPGFMYLNLRVGVYPHTTGTSGFASAEMSHAAIG